MWFDFNTVPFAKHPSRHKKNCCRLTLPADACVVFANNQGSFATTVVNGSSVVQSSEVPSTTMDCIHLSTGSMHAVGFHTHTQRYMCSQSVSDRSAFARGPNDCPLAASYRSGLWRTWQFIVPSLEFGSGRVGWSISDVNWTTAADGIGDLRGWLEQFQSTLHFRFVHQVCVAQLDTRRSLEFHDRKVDIRHDWRI